MTASIIIPTYNGASKLTTTLTALTRQTYVDFEVIVVIDGSTDDTLSVLSPFRKILRNLKVIAQINKGRAGARNEGVRNAAGRILIFIDDDIEVGENNVQVHVDFVSRNPDYILVGNPVLNRDLLARDAFLWYRYRTEKRWLSKFSAGVNSISFNHYFFTTQNVSMSRNAFLEAGGFNDALTDSEDLDLSIRLMEKGFEIFFQPELTVFHNDFANLRQTVSRQRQYYNSKEKLLMLHPHYKNLLPRQFEWTRVTWADIGKRLVFRWSFWNVILNSKFIGFLPNSLLDVVFATYIYSQSVIEVKTKMDEAFKKDRSLQ